MAAQDAQALSRSEFRKGKRQIAQSNGAEARVEATDGGSQQRTQMARKPMRQQRKQANDSPDGQELQEAADGSGGA